MPIGQLRERLLIQTPAPAVRTLSGLTRSTTTATATATAAHGYAVGDYVTVAGATPSGYNGKVKITAIAGLTFSYTVDGSLATPATGTLTVVYASDAQGGRKVTWTTLATIWAQLVPISATESLQLRAIQSDVKYRFRVRVRGDLDPTMRALWTRNWRPSGPQHTLEINGVLPDADDRAYMWLNCSESPAL